MKKLAIAFAAAAAFVLFAAPMTQAVAKDKTLWSGLMEELQKAASGTTMAKKK
jgi:hypothetical protein